MSSLRISQQNRAIGAPTSGAENARPEPTDKGASFAVALGAAGVAPKHAAAWLGGQAGDASNGAPPSRKRSDGVDKSAASAASLAASGALGAPAAAQSMIAGSAMTATVGGGATTGSTLDSIAQTAAPTATPSGGSSAAAVSIGVPSASGTPPLAGGAAPGTGSQSIGGMSLPGGGISNPLEATVSPPLANGQTRTPDGQLAATRTTDNALPVAVQAIANRAQANTAAPNSIDASPSGSPLPGASASATTDGSGTTTALVSSSDASTGTVSGAADAVLAATASLAPVPSTNANLPAMPSPDIASMLPAAGAALSLAVPNTTSSGQPDFGGSAFGLGGRGRDTPITATSTSGDATTGAAFDTGINSTASAAAPTGTDPTPAVNETTTGAISDQVTNHLLHLVSSGSREMVMRLHPAELGDLTVRVSVSGRDVSAWFASPQPQVQGAISAALDQLQTNLGNAGYNLAGAWVGAESSGAQQQGDRQQAWTPTSASLTSPSAALPAAAAVTSRPSPSGLNIYV